MANDNEGVGLNERTSRCQTSSGVAAFFFFNFSYLGSWLQLNTYQQLKDL